MSKNSRIRDNNIYGTVANFLKDNIQDGASLSFVSAYFTINAFNALRDSLTGINNLRFYSDDWKKLSIPDVSSEQQAPIVALVDKILTAKRKGLERKVSRLESYLLDDEVLIKLCEDHDEPDKVEDLLAAKQEALDSRGLKASDNLKSIVQPIHGAAQKVLKSANLGNKKESFMMDVLGPRIQPGMKVYEELHEDIFGE